MGARTTSSFRRLFAAAVVSVVAVSACGGAADDAGDDPGSSLPVRITAIREGAVAFTRDLGSGPRVYLLNRDASGGTALFAPGRSQGGPAWAPGGKIMAFDIGCGSNIAAVYVVDPYGKKRVDRAIPKGSTGARRPGRRGAACSPSRGSMEGSRISGCPGATGAPATD